MSMLNPEEDKKKVNQNIELKKLLLRKQTIGLKL